jgi:hypothetical protein
LEWRKTRISSYTADLAKKMGVSTAVERLEWDKREMKGPFSGWM